MTLPRRVVLTLLLCLFLPACSFGSAYNARPKLVVIVVIDQFRADYLDEAIVAPRNQASGRPSQKAPRDSEKIESASLLAKEGVR